MSLFVLLDLIVWGQFHYICLGYRTTVLDYVLRWLYVWIAIATINSCNFQGYSRMLYFTLWTSEFSLLCTHQGTSCWLVNLHSTANGMDNHSIVVCVWENHENQVFFRLWRIANYLRLQRIEPANSWVFAACITNCMYTWWKGCVCPEGC